MEKISAEYLKYFCEDIGERPVGSLGNRSATLKFKNIVKSYGWQVEEAPFSAMDWEENGAELVAGKNEYQVFPSPYSLGCDHISDLVEAGSYQELVKLDCAGKILLLHSEIAREQLMPKNFVFYNPEEHQQIIKALENKKPAAIISATGRNASLAGGVYPFPLIEDGDFQIPSVYMTEDNGKALLKEVGSEIHLISRAVRTQETAYHLKARRGGDAGRIAISAHIDAKKGSPGAIDNATGVIVLLLLAELLNNYQGKYGIELLPFNGEDYYGATGQMLYLSENQDLWQEIILNINIDGAGYYQGVSSLSPFNLPAGIKEHVDELLNDHPDITEGIPWFQGDHSIFLQQGVPAIVFSSQWFLENLDSQDITHTPKDHSGIVDCQKVVGIAKFISELILALD
jgi:aminopeptidase YwaD